MSYPSFPIGDDTHPTHQPAVEIARKPAPTVGLSHSTTLYGDFDVKNKTCGKHLFLSLPFSPRTGGPWGSVRGGRRAQQEHSTTRGGARFDWPVTVRDHRSHILVFGGSPPRVEEEDPNHDAYILIGSEAPKQRLPNLLFGMREPWWRCEQTAYPGSFLADRRFQALVAKTRFSLFPS